MSKQIVTRIKNKVDTYKNWKAATGMLLDGEIAIVRVPTGETYTNPVTGKNEPTWELLMKVGDGSTTFADLPWLSAKASDVYNWAKKETAAEIPVKINNADSTLGVYLAKVDTNSANITNNTNAITLLNNNDNTSGSIANKIKVAIEALDVNDTAVAGQFITTVSEADGKISISRSAIKESDLPDISATKIITTDTETLSTKLSAIDADLKALNERTNGHTDAQINTLITNKINNLDVSEPTASGTATSFIATAKQENGKIAVTKANLPEASTTTKGIVTLGVTGGAATHDSIFGKDQINDKVNANAATIKNLQTAVAGGVHFRGTVTTEPTSKTTTVGGYTIAAGDVVIYSGKEYICVKVENSTVTWEELGDVTRIGNLETKINNLDYNNTTDSGINKFVTNVTQTDGKIAVTYERPEAANVLYAAGSTDTVKTKIDANAQAIAQNTRKLVDVTSTVGASISAAINTLDFEEPVTSGDTSDYQFISTVYQTDGKITATKHAIPAASTSVKGIVKLYNDIDSTDSDTAATANAVKKAYDKGAEAAAQAANNKTAISTKCMQFTESNGKVTLKLGDSTDELIFDCGGAPTV